MFKLKKIKNYILEQKKGLKSERSRGNDSLGAAVDKANYRIYSMRIR